MQVYFLAAFAYLHWLVWPLLAVVGSMGVFAVISPTRFAEFAYRSGKWIDTNRLIAKLDKPVYVDQYVLRLGRLFGVLIVGLTFSVGYLLYERLLGG